MEKGSGYPPTSGFCHWLIRGWLALTRRKIRMLEAGDRAGEGPAIFAVSHPAGFLPALLLATATDRSVRCLFPSRVVRGPLAQFLAPRLGFILYDGEAPTSAATLGEAADVLAGGGVLAMFASQSASAQAAPDALLSTAATLVWRAEAQPAERRVAVHPVHLFLPDSAAESREILIYVDAAMDRPAERPSAASPEADAQAFAATLRLRFQENAFQLQSADLDYFITDLEDILRTDLQEDWASRPEWKQDADGFALSGSVIAWVSQVNYANPARLVRLRKSVDDYRRLNNQCALRQLQVEGADSPLQSGWRGILVLLEMAAGFPLALYGLLNHLAIILVLVLAGSFKQSKPRERSTEWMIRGAVTLGFYALQIYLVGHWRGRAAAGYYAPTLPVSGAYLWRYVELVRPQARLLFISRTIPGMSRKIRKLRRVIVQELDESLASYEAETAVANSVK